MSVTKAYLKKLILESLEIKEEFTLDKVYTISMAGGPKAQAKYLGKDEKTGHPKFIVLKNDKELFQVSGPEITIHDKD